MAKNHSITAPVPPQQNSLAHRSQFNLDWNLPRNQNRTPSSEWSFVRNYALICGTQPHNPFCDEVAQ
jgi:hypothetical protein